ncbi:glycerol-3-phosphate cytidylyltransferase [Clostridium tertium]|uniref:glycerol-3-phosphate cytidylyltransferase n=1 Tax=Clostridium tertium TaxID=1559 RepID=UPI00232CB454|nr:glycerol-3-phosphate cytidylyltransferase [Clostridium tertium]MDB1921693.1 glycerol-3-phosphate cytidylyltransferase [Clostridium tertium]MDB1924896.1 glycerol-3-phosphate cytidylyltransferase [Clostridium tertium]MDB1929535.1 glycerol-3-phosphate cytidylyltransferase [Clostridium tertium]
MRKVITYGTYDLLHYGHIMLIKRAKSIGDYLIVGLSTDEFNYEKGKRSYFSYEKRKVILESIQYIDEVIPEKNWKQKVNDIKERNIDVFVIGDDWKGKFDYLNEYCEVIYLPRTEGISTSLIKEEISKSEL